MSRPVATRASVEQSSGMYPTHCSQMRINQRAIYPSQQGSVYIQWWRLRRVRILVCRVCFSSRLASCFAPSHEKSYGLPQRMLHFGDSGRTSSAHIVCISVILRACLSLVACSNSSRYCTLRYPQKRSIDAWVACMAGVAITS